MKSRNLRISLKMWNSACWSIEKLLKVPNYVFWWCLGSFEMIFDKNIFQTFLIGKFFLAEIQNFWNFSPEFACEWQKLCLVFFRAIPSSTRGHKHTERCTRTCYSWFVPVAAPKLYVMSVPSPPVQAKRTPGHNEMLIFLDFQNPCPRNWYDHSSWNSTELNYSGVLQIDIVSAFVLISTALSMTCKHGSKITIWVISGAKRGKIRWIFV